MKKGPVIILSGPSGSGKSTVIRQLMQHPDRPLRLSVSATTRPKRKGERDEVDYHFWTRAYFQDQMQAGAFLEWAEVHGQYYGTLRTEVDSYRDQGMGVILDIDVQGAAQIRQQYPDSLTIFLRTSTTQMYEQRLRQRGTEDEASIARRLETARRELERQGEYDHVVINDDLEAAVAQIRGLIARFCKGESCA
jgi:guanylate kinase